MLNISLNKINSGCRDDFEKKHRLFPLITEQSESIFEKEDHAKRRRDTRNSLNINLYATSKCSEYQVGNLRTFFV